MNGALPQEHGGLSLRALLFTSVSALFLLVLVGVQLVYVANARNYLQEQLMSHSQDAATSLGLSLSQPLAGQDAILAELVVSAAFDRGFYQEVRVVDARDRTVLLRTLPPGALEVPAWFVRLLALDAPVAESLISSGWRQLGRVIVRSHPNFAYKQLWRTAVESLSLMAALYLLGMGLLWLLLRALLRPLRAIERAAGAISERHFVAVAPIPVLRELRSVALSFNVMASRIEQVLGEETRRANLFQMEAYQDALTGLENRRSFEAQLHAMVDDAGVGRGALVMLEILQFNEFNRRRGFQAGDELLRQVAADLLALEGKRFMVVARINVGTFAMAAPNIGGEECEALGHELCRRLRGRFAEQGYAEAGFSCGIAHYEGRVDCSSLLACAGQAMVAATQKERNGFSLIRETQQEQQGRGAPYWRQTLAEATEKNRLELLAQPVLAMDWATVLQRELIARMTDGTGRQLSAGEFFPMAARHGMTARLDRALMELLLGSEQARDQAGLAFNLSAHSLADEGLVAWLFDVLCQHPDLAGRLVFEIAEFSVETQEEAVDRFARGLREVGGHLALDHFGLSRFAIRRLRTLAPDYVKLSASFTRELAQDQGNQFFISSIVRIAHPLGIRVYAQAVEDAETLAALQKLGVDGYQGYLAGRPAPYLNG